MEISLVDDLSKTAVSIRDHCKPEALSKKYEEIYAELSALLKKQSLFEMADPPFGIYHSFTVEDVDVEAGIPVRGVPEAEGRMKVMNTYGGKSLCGKFYGSYTKLKEGWDEMMAYMKENGFEPSAPPFEVYITDPGAEPDPSKWLTEIHIPVK